jgi:hypothetical protein
MPKTFFLWLVLRQEYADEHQPLNASYIYLFNQTKYVGKKADFFVIKKIKSYNCKTILDAPIQLNIALF